MRCCSLNSVPQSWTTAKSPGLRRGTKQLHSKGLLPLSQKSTRGFGRFAMSCRIGSIVASESKSMVRSLTPSFSSCSTGAPWFAWSIVVTLKPRTMPWRAKNIVMPPLKVPSSRTVPICDRLKNSSQSARSFHV